MTAQKCLLCYVNPLTLWQLRLGLWDMVTIFHRGWTWSVTKCTVFSSDTSHCLRLEVMEGLACYHSANMDCHVTPEPRIKVCPHSLPSFGFSLQILFRFCHIFTSAALLLTHEYIWRNNMSILFWPLSCHVFYERKKINTALHLFGDLQHTKC